MKRWIIGGAVVVAVTAAASTWAAIPGANGVINACYIKNVGILRVIDEGRQCSKLETALSWNTQGPKGDKGDRGDTGPQGPPGPTELLGMGPGLEKVVLSAPPPVGDQTQLQLKQGFRLPQACAAGAIPQRSSSGDGWQCGSGSGPSSHAYIARGGIFTSLRPEPAAVASLTVPAGSYVISGKASILNAEAGGDDQDANCTLSTGDVSEARIGFGHQQVMTVVDTAAFVEEATITLTCATFRGTARRAVLVATRVAGIN